MKSRRSVHADYEVIRIIQEIADRKGLLGGVTFDRAVIVEYTRSYHRDLQSLCLREDGKDDDRALQDLLLRLKRESPKRWADTSRTLKDHMTLFGLSGDHERLVPLTLWIGKSLIEESVKKQKPLVALLLKNITERLARKIPELQIGLWLNIERSTSDEWAVHAHGFMFVNDARYLNGALLQQVRTEIIAASGRRHVISKQRILDLGGRLHPGHRLNLGWVVYCGKQQRGSKWQTVRRSPPPLAVGVTTLAKSHLLTRRASRFYTKARQLVRAIQSSETLVWVDEDWARLNA